MNVEFSDGHETYLSAGGGVWARYILEVATKQLPKCRLEVESPCLNACLIV